MLDDGRLADGQGRTEVFHNTVTVMAASTPLLADKRLAEPRLNLSTSPSEADDAYEVSEVGV